MSAADAERDAARRRVILDAALACFLQFGYAKTSLDDIAKRAKLSRPLLYRKYKNKEAIFGALHDDLYGTRIVEGLEIVRGRGSKRERLTRAFDLLMVETWALVADSPMVAEFYDACMKVNPELNARHAAKFLEIAREVIGNRDVAEVFLFAIDGLYTDLPSTPVLRKRLHILVERFTA